jgi:tetratricopeptide (TPR) repeat protein
MSKKVNKKNNSILIAIAFLFVAVMIVFFYPRKRFHEKINDIRKETVPMFDSLSNQLNKDNNFQTNINLLIEHNDLLLAHKLIDTAIQKNPTKGIYYTYKGMAYAAEKKYKIALQKYDTSILINKSEFPLALSKKAEAFTALKDYSNAIENYKKAALLNSDFNYQVAATFEATNKKDSALKYYLVFQKHYPENKSVINKIELLSK